MNYWKDKKVLVTGGCGFLGSYLTEELVAVGAIVTVVDNLESGSLDNIAAVRSKITFVLADLCQIDVCKKVSKEAEVIMNLAAFVRGVGYSSKHHGEMLYKNTTIQLNMLEAARINNVDRFLAVSSSCIYPDNSKAPISELSTTHGLPESSNAGYGWSKRIAELQAGYYSKEYGIKTAIVRPTNICGGRYPWWGENDSFVMPTLVKKIMDGNEEVLVWGNGLQSRNFLHARDVSRLFMLIIENYACGTPVNVGYENDITIKDLVELICEITQKSPKIIFDETKPSGCLRKCVDSTLLRGITNSYKPRISLEETIQEMIVWYGKTF